MELNENLLNLWVNGPNYKDTNLEPRVYLAKVRVTRAQLAQLNKNKEPVEDEHMELEKDVSKDKHPNNDEDSEIVSMIDDTGIIFESFIWKM